MTKFPEKIAGMVVLEDAHSLVSYMEHNLHDGTTGPHVRTIELNIPIISDGDLRSLERHIVSGRAGVSVQVLSWTRFEPPF